MVNSVKIECAGNQTTGKRNRVKVSGHRPFVRSEKERKQREIQETVVPGIFIKTQNSWRSSVGSGSIWGGNAKPIHWRWSQPQASPVHSLLKCCMRFSSSYSSLLCCSREKTSRSRKQRGWRRMMGGMNGMSLIRQNNVSIKGALNSLLWGIWC